MITFDHHSVGAAGDLFSVPAGNDGHQAILSKSDLFARTADEMP